MKCTLEDLAFWLLLLFSATGFTQGIEIKYEQLPELVQKSSRIEASKIETEAAEERRGFLIRSFFPTLSLQAAQESFSVGRKEGLTQPTYGAELNVNLFNSGRDKAESAIRDLASDGKRFQQQRITSDELQKSRVHYWNILYLQERFNILESAIKINKQNLNSAQRRFRSGVALESDRMEFEMKAVGLNREQRETQLKLAVLKRELMILLSLPLDSELKFPAVLSHEHDFLVQLKHGPKDHEFLYKENELLAEVRLLSANNSKRSWLPRIDGFAAYNQFNERVKEFSNAQDRTETVVGLKVSMNLAEGWQGRTEASALMKESLSFYKTVDLQKREIEAHLENEIEELEFLHSQVHDAEENISRAEKYYKLTQNEYIRGVKNSPDVLGASEKVFDTMSKRIEIIRDFQISKVHILSKIGK